MVRLIYAVIITLAITDDVRSQFFDFFPAFQPGYQTLRPLRFDLTTKRPRSEPRTTKIRQNPSKSNSGITFLTDDDNNKQRQKQRNTAINNNYATTLRPIRRTTKSVSSQSNNSNNGNIRETNKTPKETTKQTNRGTNKRVDNKKRPPHPAIIDNDKYIFDDGRNVIINYETTKRYPDYDKRYTTEYPVTSRPGVRPIITNGPPITNKPATVRPSFGIPDDTSVSPELIIGPNEDYMNNVEKKRYIEIAERMCDRYKALDIKQIQAIPLLPSPTGIKVNVSSCTPNTNPLVVGGKVVNVQDFPHMALLGWVKARNGGYAWRCGGSLISERYVLTAAHCAYQDRDDSVLSGPPRAVQLGSTYMDDPSAVVVKVSAVVRHPKYKLPKSYYDLALIKMSTTVTFSKLIKPACLGIPPPPGEPIIATGWGKTEFGGDQSHELRSVSIPVWDIDECFEVLGTSRKIPDGPSSGSQICAGDKKGGKDTCQGDSGGPAQIRDGCTWRIVAVTSLGRSCGAVETPALYARVQRVFISAVVFGDQINKNSISSNTQTQQQSNNNQWTKQWDNDQQSTVNNRPTSTQNQQQSNNKQWNTNQQPTVTKKPSNTQNQQQSNDNQGNQQWNGNQQPSVTYKPSNTQNQQQSNDNQRNQQWSSNRQPSVTYKPSNIQNQQQSNDNQRNQQWSGNQQPSVTFKPSNILNQQQSNDNQRNQQWSGNQQPSVTFKPSNIQNQQQSSEDQRNQQWSGNQQPIVTYKPSITQNQQQLNNNQRNQQLGGNRQTNLNSRPSNTQNTQQSTNQWNNQQSNSNQQNWNRELNTAQTVNKRGEENQNDGSYQPNNQQNNGYYNQNSNNNGYTTIRPVNNRPQNNYYNDYVQIPDYQSDGIYNSDGGTWWT